MKKRFIALLVVVSVLSSSLLLLADEPSDLKGRKVMLARQPAGERLFQSALDHAIKGNHRQAIADLEEAVRVEPKLRTARFYSRRSDQYFMLREFEEAEADLRNAITLEPENAEHYVSLGMVFDVQEDWDGAIVQYERAYELLADDRRDLANGKLGSEAIPNLLEPVSRARDRLVMACLERAGNRRTNGDAKGAQADYDRAVEVNPKLSYARVARASFMAGQGKFDEALKDCEIATRLDPGSSMPLCQRGAVYQMKGDFAKAIDTLTQAIILFPQDAVPYSGRGAVWGNFGDLKKALDDFNRAIDLDSENPLYYAQRAHTFRELKREAEAAADTKKFQELIAGGTKSE